MPSNLPPGVTLNDIDRHFGEQPCAVCAGMYDMCVCPECPQCKTYGDPACYKKKHLELNQDQKINLAEHEVRVAEENVYSWEFMISESKFRIEQAEKDEVDTTMARNNLKQDERGLAEALKRLEDAKTALKVMLGTQP